MEEEIHKELHTYKAVIRHDPVEHRDHVEWISGKPKTDVPIEVEISVEDEPQPTAQERRAKAAAALREIAKMGGTGIEDPVAWQKEQRKEWS